jgi:hypothetical protein
VVGKDIVGKIIQYYLNSSIKKFYTIEQWLKDGDSRYMKSDDWQIKKFAYALKQICSILTGIPVEDLEDEKIKSSYLGEEWNHFNFYTGNSKVTHKVCKTRKEAINRLPNGYLLDGKPIIVKGINERYTVRELLQKVGTDAMRDVIHPDVWVNALMKDYKSIIHLKDDAPFTCHHGLTPEFKEKYVEFIEYPNWLVTDVRFPNEAKGIKDRQGIVIRVNRPCSTCHTYDNKFCSNGYHSNNHISETSLDTYNFDYVIENDSDIPSLIEKVKEMLIHFKLLEC